MSSLKATELLGILEAKEAQARAKAELVERSRVEVLTRLKSYNPDLSIEENIEAFIKARVAGIRSALDLEFQEELRRLEPSHKAHSNGMITRIL